MFLALGAWRISRRGVLTRRMPAIEMLGAATVLCVDKTGTLTENRMTVVETAPEVIDAAALACEIEPFDPMDRAIVAAAGPRAARSRREWRLERDYPLTDDFLAMCHAWRSPQGEVRVTIKGAPETVLSMCGLDEPAVAGAMERGRERIAEGLAPARGGRGAMGGALSGRPGSAIRSAGWDSSRSPIRCALRCPRRSRSAGGPASAS